MDERTTRIRTMNDRLRVSGIGGQVVMTAGVAARGEAFAAAVMHSIGTYSNFNPENDPRGEHDLGAMEVEGAKLFWKIDYYAPGLEGGSEDPSDATKTDRVLTIMLARDY